MFNIKNITFTVTALSFISAMLFMGYAVDWKAEDVGVYGVLPLLFGSLPFVVLMYSTHKVYKRNFSKAAQVALCITALLVGVSTLLIYIYIMFISTSSTAGLGFMTWPVVSIFLIPIVYYVSKGLTKQFAKKSHASLTNSDIS